MSDFDKFFKEKLDEEQTFPRRNRSWKSVSKRLDAFDAGGLGGFRQLRYWQLAAIAAGIGLVVISWQYARVRKENTQLQQQNERLQQNKAVAAEEVPAANVHPAVAASDAQASPKNTQIPTLAQITPSSDDAPNYNTSRKQPASEPQQPFAAQPARAEQRRANKDEATPPTRSGQPTGNKPDNNATADFEQPLPQRSTSVDQAARETADAQPTSDAEAATPAADSTQQLAPPVASTPQPDMAAPTPLVDALDTVSKAVTDKEISAEETNIHKTDSMSLAATSPDKNPNTLPDTSALAQTPPVIRPLQQYDRIRLGAHFLAGTATPQENGVSLLTGQGVSAQWRFWRGFSLLAGVDWLRFDLNTTKFVPRFHPHHPHPDPHGGPFPQQELVQVETTQRQRQLALGLCYTPSWHTWIRPSLRVAHNWVHIAPQLISFKFEEPAHGGGPQPGNPGPRYLVEKTETQKLDNIWRFGLGVERETARWVFQIGADYSRNFAPTDDLFDTLLLRAGLQYKIL